jgi:hypothetical protein
MTIKTVRCAAPPSPVYIIIIIIIIIIVVIIVMYVDATATHSQVSHNSHINVTTHHHLTEGT